MPRFYITTAIDYVNGSPHLGHAYEKVLADALARWHRQQGHATYFLTGTDEHGQKVARSAAAEGKDPKAYVDEISKRFSSAWQALDVSYDQFFRTTDRRHELAVQELFRRLNDALSPKTGQKVLFSESYEGLYCEGCEAFKTDKDLDEKGECPIHHSVPKKVEETNFFFRLSEYDDALRFYLLDSFATGRDGEFTLEQFVEHCNTHLANKLGNLASRTTTLVHKNFAGEAPAEWNPDAFTDAGAREGLDAVLAAAATAAVEVPKAWQELRLNEALEHAWLVVERANEFVDRTKPWELAKDPARRDELATTLSALLEVLRLVSVWAWPAMPTKCDALWTTLGLTGSPGDPQDGGVQPAFGATAARTIGATSILFPRIDVKALTGEAKA